MRSPSVTGSLFVTQVKLLGPQGINNDLTFQVPNLDAFVSGSAQPVPVGTEHKRVNDFAGVKRVQTLALVQIPEHGGT